MIYVAIYLNKDLQVSDHKTMYSVPKFSADKKFYLDKFINLFRTMLVHKVE